MDQASPPDFDIPEMTPGELKQRLDQEQPIVLIDVREPHEYAIADLAEFDPMRMPMAEVLTRLDDIDADAPTVVYCRSGGRSAWVVNQLRARGFENVHNLAGGILRWREDVDPSLNAY